MSEVTAKLRFYQISHATAKNVCHRDLKLENVLLMKNSRDSLLVSLSILAVWWS